MDTVNIKIDDYVGMETEKQGSKLLWRKEDDKFILLARHDMYVLNEFSKEVFDLCDGSKTVKTIIDYCCSKYQVPIETAEANIKKLLEFGIEKTLIYVRRPND